MPSLKIWAGKLRSETLILYRASRDPRTPRIARAFVLMVIAYALSPIDLIPDFIPVIGHLDDLVLIPLGIYLGIKMIPAEVLDQYRREVDSAPKENPALGSLGALLVLCAWILSIGLAIWGGRILMDNLPG